MARRLNILLLVTDQEQHHSLVPPVDLRAKGELLEKGRGFAKYNVHTTPCSPSRSTMYFGLHTQRTKMTANHGMPPFPRLRRGLRSIGHMLRDRGYVTAYKGKWHLGGVGHAPDLTYGPFPSTQRDLQRFGFSDYNFDGDPHGTTRTGLRFDRQIAAEAVEWLHRRPTDRPWLLAVNFVNPHDIMYFAATDGQVDSRVGREFLGPLRGAPGVDPYDRAWDHPLPVSFADDLRDRPWAVRSYADLVERVYGVVPRDDEAAWHRLRSYYFNCIRDVDAQALRVLRALDDLNVADETVVIYTSDHGEMAGAHGMRQKGPMIFRENISVPFIVRHPDVDGGTETDALASPIDLAPTLLSIAGVDPHAEPQLAGVDLSPAIASPAGRTARDERGILYNYGVTMYIDPELALKLVRTGETIDRRLFRRVALRHALTKHPFRNRGFFRGVFDGRYKFARYFRPREHHQPRDFAELVRRNDLELYDTEADPHELDNLGARPDEHRETLTRLNAMTNALVAREVGDDEGGEHLGPRWLYTRG